MKPLVMIICRWLDDGHIEYNNQKALIHLLQKKYNCQVAGCRDRQTFSEEFPKMEWLEQQSLKLILWYDHSMIQSRRFRNLPGIVNPLFDGQKQESAAIAELILNIPKQAALIFINVEMYDPADLKMLASFGRVANLSQSYEENPLFEYLEEILQVGYANSCQTPETTGEVDWIMTNLATAYRRNYLGENEEKMLAVPDYNGQIVAEAIRCRLLPSSTISQEYDQAVWAAQEKVFEPKDDEEINRTIRQIKSLNEQQKEDLRYLMSNTSRGSSLGNCRALYMDPETLLYEISHGSGDHGPARIRLIATLTSFAGLKWAAEKRPGCDPRVNEEEKYFSGPFVEGLIYEVNGYSVPLLHLLGTPKWLQKNQRVIEYLKSWKKFVVINYNIELL